MLLVLGKPKVALHIHNIGDHWFGDWYREADHWLCDQGIATPGQRRTIINDFTTWVRNKEKSDE